MSLCKSSVHDINDRFLKSNYSKLCWNIIAKMAAEEIIRKANRFRSLVTQTFSRYITRKKAAWMSILRTKTIREEVTGKSSATINSIMLKRFNALKYRGNATSTLATNERINDIPTPTDFRLD